MSDTAPQMPPVAGLVLAGGLSRRMGGGDKTLLLLDGRPMLLHVLDRVAPQVGPLAINANGDPDRFAPFGRPVVPDELEGFPGPLAGILAGLEWVRRDHPTLTHLLTVPADAPFLPRDMVDRLWARIEAGADIACAASGGWTHPPIALWPVRLRKELRAAVIDEGMRKIDAWTARYRTEAVEWQAAPLDPFYNVNRPEDLDAAKDLLEQAAAREAAPDVPASKPFGVVIERRTSSHPWGSDAYVPVAVAPGVPAGDPVRQAEADRWVTGGVTLELFRKETEGYRRNLSTPTPRIYVILRPVTDDDGNTYGPLPVKPVLVTACPYEAEAYLHGDETQVEAVPMPDDVAHWVGAFCARHHVDQPFVKRKQKTKVAREDDTFSRIPPVQQARRDRGAP
ncbi:molybdenum cofactor guanylyltransferase MobA [Caenispirillum salinarum]|uniref:molybdenum cofactor guanylyltransferase MobA n=1 Tax=Caenispirillum salinarum TaxID=859058 RepID=UPI00384AE0DD